MSAGGRSAEAAANSASGLSTLFKPPNLRNGEYTKRRMTVFRPGGCLAMNNYVKFGILIVAILGTLAWLAAGGSNDTKNYHQTTAARAPKGGGGEEKRPPRGWCNGPGGHDDGGAQRFSSSCPGKAPV